MKRHARVGTARAHANIALAKYWGKADEALNLPAVPSVSMTLSPLLTRTRVEFAERFQEDRLVLDGEPARPGELARAVAVLDRARAAARLSLRAEVTSGNDFPTASGLASSASGFCALVAAARAAAGLPFDRTLISAWARQASVSAARSAFGGYVELPLARPDAGVDAQDHAASPLAPPEHFALRIVVAVTSEGRKAVGSTDGMKHTARTSPFYASWVAAAPALASEVREGVLAVDLPRIGRAMEQSTFAMHASAMAAAPAVIYFREATLSAFATVRALREDKGIEVFATADAGPHVKALCRAADVDAVREALEATPGVLRTLLAEPGAGVELEA